MTYQTFKTLPDLSLFNEQGPFVSIYLPTHRQLPDRRQDATLFRQLVKALEETLDNHYPPTEVAKLRRILFTLEKDSDFWENVLEGMAVLATPDHCEVYRLNQKVQPLAIAADSFHLKPLIAIFQQDLVYQVLAISGKEYTLFQGNQYQLEEVVLDPSIPRTIEEILGSEHSEKFITPGTYGAGGGTFFHGQGSKKDDSKEDLDRFYRQVDHLVYEHASKESKLPLLLAILKDHDYLYRHGAKNPYLLEESLDYSFDTHDLLSLREKAWTLLKPYFEEKTNDLLKRFQEKAASGLGSRELTTIAKAVLEKRVSVLFLEADRIVYGKVVDELGEIELYEDGALGVDDLLDDLAALVLKQQGEVVLLEKEKMPGNSGAAAIFRY